jgi:hypothetical protein
MNSLGHPCLDVSGGRTQDHAQSAEPILRLVVAGGTVVGSENRVKTKFRSETRLPQTWAANSKRLHGLLRSAYINMTSPDNSRMRAKIIIACSDDSTHGSMLTATWRPPDV